MALAGNAVVVLLAREALLLRGGDEPAVDHQRGRGVVVEGADPEDVHLRTLSAARSRSGSRLREECLRNEPGALLVRVHEVPEHRLRRAVECVAQVDDRRGPQQAPRLLHRGDPAGRFVAGEPEVGLLLRQQSLGEHGRLPEERGPCTGAAATAAATLAARSWIDTACRAACTLASGAGASMVVALRDPLGELDGRRVAAPEQFVECVVDTTGRALVPVRVDHAREAVLVALVVRRRDVDGNAPRRARLRRPDGLARGWSRSSWSAPRSA